ncbi:MAG: transglutaminase-like domain-containing protein [Clostridia bacterium]|jgi:transglutaminase-like putative cysteine protease|nr:transglutaminase-like domain-containing protein [Clostridia bacterium]
MTESNVMPSVPLPEDIQRRKWAGDIKGALAAISARLNAPLPQVLRDRLELEREVLIRLPTQYPYDQNGALAKMREHIADFTQEELDALDLEGRVDWIFLDDEKRYFVRFHRTLLKYPALAQRAGECVSAASEWLDPLIERLRREGSLTARASFRAELSVRDASFIPEETYRAHLPIPANAPQTTDIHVCFPGFAPLTVGRENEPQRTAYFAETLLQNAAFTCEYAFVQTIRYADLSGSPPVQPLYPDAPPPAPEDVAEEGDCIRFMPYMRALCQEVTAGCGAPAAKVRAIYDYITRHVEYAFVRDYLQITDPGGYAAVNLRGDCGLQALLFIILCRIAGIPARWQSGAVITRSGIGSHDWAQFYLPGWGWLFADCSFGGSAFRTGSEERRRFYLGNLEPLRIVYNSACQKPLNPPKRFIRIDPYDNQTGEIECGRKGFNGRETEYELTLLSLEYDG